MQGGKKDRKIERFGARKKGSKKKGKGKPRICGLMLGDSVLAATSGKKNVEEREIEQSKKKMRK